MLSYFRPRLAASIAAAVTVIGGLLTGPAHADMIYDVAAQFDPGNDPSSLGPWSYGWKTALDGTLTLFTTTGSVGPVSGWQGSGSATVSHNSAPGAYATGTVRWEEDQALFHPGSGGEIAVFRFTAPSAGFYDISASFSGNDVAGTTTDVHLLVNDVSLFDGLVNSAWSDGSMTPGAGPSFATSSSLSLLAGATIDFAVGRGTNDNYFFDSTGIDASITQRELRAVPEPASVTIFGIGFVCLAAGAVVRRRKTSQTSDAGGR